IRDGGMVGPELALEHVAAPRDQLDRLAMPALARANPPEVERDPAQVRVLGPELGLPDRPRPVERVGRALEVAAQRVQRAEVRERQRGLRVAGAEGALASREHLFVLLEGGVESALDLERDA